MIIIDNYDSFTYNILQCFYILGYKFDVVRNNLFSVDQILDRNPRLLVIGPGPGNPLGAGISKKLIEMSSVPVLGICLGHQAIGEVFGAEVIRAPQVMHGKTSLVYHEGGILYQNIPSPFEATRYHSLIVKNLSNKLELEAWTSCGEIMGLRHKKRPIFGIQFHPESIATKYGLELLKNFVEKFAPQKESIKEIV
ncbi:MAG: aminodeoxychorismate/anthranilate synthase component II [Chlamydiales bacterium]